MKKIILIIGLFVLTFSGFAQYKDLTLPYNLGKTTICDGTWNIERQIDMSLNLSNGACPGTLSYEFTFEVWSSPSEITRIWVSKNADMSEYREIHYKDQDQGTRSGTAPLNKDEKYIRVWAKNKGWSSTKIFLNRMNVTRSVNIPDDALAIDAYVKRPITKTFRVQGSNLVGDLQVEMTGGDAEIFSINTDVITKAEAEAGYDVVVTYSPTVKGVNNCSIKVTDLGYVDSYDEILIRGNATHLIEPSYGIIYADNRTTEDTGTGSSWENAISMEIVNDAIANANVTEIWVREGECFVNETIKLRGGVSMYGGFAGEEASVDNRNWSANPTILKSGNGGTVGIIGDRIGDDIRANVDGFILEGTTNARAVESKTPNLAIVNCIIRNNTLMSGTGAGVEFGSTCFLENSFIYNNTSSENGGGLCVYGDGASVIKNCTFVNNNATNGIISSVYVNNSSTFYNCIFSGNIENKDLVGGTGNEFYNCAVSDTSSIPLSNGNMKDTNPLLDENGNLTLLSPCIDAGNNSYAAGDVDLNLDKRIQGGTIDMGAFEYKYFAVVGVIEGGEGTINGIGEHRKGTNIELSATLNDPLNQKISSWSMGGAIISETETCSFILTDDSVVILTIIDKLDVIVEFNDLSHIYDGTSKEISYTTNPEVECVLTYKIGDLVTNEYINAENYTVELTFAGNEDYKPFIKMETMVINPAEISVLELPTTSTLTYEETLSNSTFEGGKVNATIANDETVAVEGVWSWTDPNVVPKAGGHEYDATFTPNSSNYGVKSGIMIMITVDKAVPTILTNPKASTLMYGYALSTSTLTDGEASVEGVFSWVDETIVADAVGDSQFLVRFTPNDLDNYDITTFELTVAVDKANVEGISFDGMTFVYDGQEHAIEIAGDLPEGASVTYKNNRGTDVSSYNAEAIISGGINYQDVTLNAVLTINKASFPTSLITFNNKLIEWDGNEHAILIEGELPMNASVVYVNNTGTEEGIYEATAQVVGSLNYEDSEVMKATLEITKKTVINVTINNTAFVYDGSAKNVDYTVTPNNVTLTVVYKKNGEVVADPTIAGSYDFEISYTEDETHKGVIITGVMIISKATPVISEIPTATDIVYEQYLQESELTGGSASIDGTFKWVNGDAIMPTAGVHSYQAVFIPADDVNYNTIDELDITVNVSQAESIIVVTPKASSITFGQALSESTFTNGETLTAGEFTWINGNTVYNAGIYSENVIFTPTDNANYKTKTFSTLVEVKKATIDGDIAFEGKTATYNEARHSIEITGTLPDGASVYYRNNQATNAGTYNATAIVDGGVNYNSFELTATLVIEKADIDADITFEDLSVTYDGMYHSIEIDEALLPAGASVTYTNNKALHVGVYNAVAVVSGGVNYNNMEDLTATLEIAAAEIKDITFNDITVDYDGSLHSTVIDGTLPLGVRVSYSNNYGIDAGIYEATATLTGLNFETVELTATITINKIDIQGITFENKTVNYDGSYHSIEITGTLPEGAGLTYSNNRGRDVAIYNAVATINGGLNYNSFELEATLTINIAEIGGITFTGKSVVYDGTKQSITIDGTLPTGLNVVYSENEATNAGEYNAKATISGDNFTTVELTAVLEITKATANIVTAPIASELNSGDVLSISKLSGGKASVAGTFAWEDGETTITESGQFKVIFTPIDIVNYNTIESMIQVNIKTTKEDGDVITDIDENSELTAKVYSYGMNIHVQTETNAKVDVIDISGRIAAEQAIESGNSVITMNRQGIYVVIVIADNKVIKTQKVIIK